MDKLLTFNDKPILQTAGRISHAQMEQKVAAIYTEFDARRKHEQALEADAQDLQDLAAISNTVTNSKRGKK